MDDKELTVIAENMLSIFPLIIKKFSKIGDFENNQCLPVSQCNILFLLHTFEILTMSEISKRLSINKSNLTPLIDKLISEDLVKRTPGEKDRRIIQISLTEKGIKFVENHKVLAVSKLKEKFSQFNEEELKELSHSFSSINKIISKMQN